MDNLSDVDLEVVVTEKLYRKVSAYPKVNAQHCGINIWWEWMTFQEFASQLKGWKDDIGLWVHAKSKVLYDPKHKLDDFLYRYKHYPKKIWLENSSIIGILQLGMLLMILEKQFKEATL